MVPYEQQRPANKLGLALTIGSAAVEIAAGSAISFGAWKVLNDNLPYLAANYFTPSLASTDIFVLSTLATTPAMGTFVHGTFRIANYLERMKKSA